MKKILIIIAALIACAPYLLATESHLSSGEYFITQSWSQETSYNRPYFVNVATDADAARLPVLIYLHGNGGNAEQSLRGFLRRHPAIASRYLLVFPQGYLKSWNIVSERSKANDRAFIEAIVEEVCSHVNAEKGTITIMGVSNGAALVNQLAIESDLPNVRNYITAVSPLNVFQHDGSNFKAKGDHNNYLKSITPSPGKRILNVSGTEDRLVPYAGGPSQGIRAKEGKLAFVNAERSIFLWAKAMGFQGDQLVQPSQRTSRYELFSYLDGNVVHYKALGEGHGATRIITEQILMDFMLVVP